MHGEAPAPDGVAIRYTTEGGGTPALVLVHGWSCDQGHWEHQLRSFADRHRVVAIDLAGHGASGQERASWSIQGFAEDVVAVVDQLDLADVVLIGHSMGGDVVVDAALALGQRVRGLVWVDVYGDLDSPRSPEAIEAFIAGFADDFGTSTDRFVRGMFPADADPAVVERVSTGMASRPPTIAIAAMRASISNDARVGDQLRRLTVPVVAIDPGERADVESLGRHGLSVVAMPGVGHFPMLEDPARFDAVLAEIITRF